MTREDAGHLVYRDPRADVRVLPTMHVVDGLPAKGRLRSWSGNPQHLTTAEALKRPAVVEGQQVKIVRIAELRGYLLRCLS
ncbi:hypothetical protein DDE74_04865 [Streptomyces lydicus]|uniref:Uncharacterized protein n=1 Tax=Streptomyces lydicus TaxID=47763 RepID=A0A3Q9K6V7_9ACTN|nr:hypothetical protein [Streptomyces lydicus]AZS70354.1 hypothetical protein DDE74_04865 [Streptomyces lydicus]